MVVALALRAGTQGSTPARGIYYFIFSLTKLVCSVKLFLISFKPKPSTVLSESLMFFFVICKPIGLALLIVLNKLEF